MNSIVTTSGVTVRTSSICALYVKDTNYLKINLEAHTRPKAYVVYADIAGGGVYQLTEPVEFEDQAVELLHDLVLKIFGEEEYDGL